MVQSAWLGWLSYLPPLALPWLDLLPHLELPEQQQL